MNPYVKTAREVLDETPARNPEAVGDYIKQLKRAQSDLKSYVGGARTLGDKEYLIAGSLLEDMKERLPMAELLLSAVRDEIVLDDVVEVASGDEDEVDLQKTTEAVAHKAAIETVAQPAFSRVVEANNQFDHYVLPHIPQGLDEFPRARYNELFADLMKLSSEELASKIAAEYPKSFPTDEWIGPPPQGGVEHMTSNFEQDASPAPPDADVDGEIEEKQNAERRYRGIPKNKETTSSLQLRKGMKVSARIELVAADENGSLAVPEGTEGEVVEEHGESEGEGLFEVDFEGTEDTVLVPESLIEAKVAVEDKSKVKMMGEGTFTSPLVEDAMEEEFREEQDKDFRQAEGKAPRGPNRRLQQDVNAYSTPKKKLTSALEAVEVADKVASNFENMSREDALRILAIVQLAQGDDEEEGPEFKVDTEPDPAAPSTNPTPEGAGVGSIPSEAGNPGVEEPEGGPEKPEENPSEG